MISLRTGRTRSSPYLPLEPWLTIAEVHAEGEEGGALRARPVPVGSEGFRATSLEGLDGGLRWRFLAVQVAGRKAGVVLAVAATGVVLVGGRLQVAVLQFLYVARRDSPVGVAADLQRENLLSQFATGGGHRLSVRTAIGQAVRAFDLDAVLAPLADQLMLGTGGDGDVTLAILEVEA
ncbi:hypothetical protein I5J15_20350 [Pseudomonas aeruginosa]|nr:hypothetical protein [Pseudomonas aeruginosa]